MWWAGWAEAFIDNAMRARDTLKLVDANPLGTAAGYGVNLKLDREHTTTALGFARMQVSPLYAQLSRGKFEMAALEALGGATLDLRRIARDLSLFASAEFGFVELPAPVHHRQFDHAEQAQSRRHRTDACDPCQRLGGTDGDRTAAVAAVRVPPRPAGQQGRHLHGFGRGLPALELLPLLANLGGAGTGCVRRSIRACMPPTSPSRPRSPACRSAGLQGRCGIGRQRGAGAHAGRQPAARVSPGAAADPAPG